MQDAADELAWQVEGGAAAARVTWKWACYAAAEAAANATPGGFSQGGLNSNAAPEGRTGHAIELQRYHV